MRPHHRTLNRHQVHRSATGYLQRHIPLRDYKRKVTARTLWAVLLVAAADVTSLHAACGQLDGLASEETLRKALYACLPEYVRFYNAFGRDFFDPARPEMAAAALAEAVGNFPGYLRLRFMHVLSLLAAGDRPGYRRACGDLVARGRPSTVPGIANEVAWCCALAPDAVADPDTPVRLAEVALAGIKEEEKHLVLNTLGAALYRAGRFEEAIRRLDESVARRGVPEDWAFLAMAHQRLGHHEEALRWLARLRDRPFSGSPEQFWEEFQVRLLRREAEAVVVEDPIFPDNPFAP
jgi:tetratricopeptide (TPR) repeat protein